MSYIFDIFLFQVPAFVYLFVLPFHHLYHTRMGRVKVDINQTHNILQLQMSALLN